MGHKTSFIIALLELCLPINMYTRTVKRTPNMNPSFQLFEAGVLFGFCVDTSSFRRLCGDGCPCLYCRIKMYI